MTSLTKDDCAKLHARARPANDNREWVREHDESSPLWHWFGHGQDVRSACGLEPIAGTPLVSVVKPSGYVCARCVTLYESKQEAQIDNREWVRQRHMDTWHWREQRLTGTSTYGHTACGKPPIQVSVGDRAFTRQTMPAPKGAFRVCTQCAQLYEDSHPEPKDKPAMPDAARQLFEACKAARDLLRHHHGDLEGKVYMQLLAAIDGQKETPSEQVVDVEPSVFALNKAQEALDYNCPEGTLTPVQAKRTEAVARMIDELVPGLLRKIDRLINKLRAYSAVPKAAMPDAARDTLLGISNVLVSAFRFGDVSTMDEPEGEVHIRLSDTLARQLAEQLCEVAGKFAETTSGVTEQVVNVVHSVPLSNYACVELLEIAESLDAATVVEGYMEDGILQARLSGLGTLAIRLREIAHGKVT